MTAEEVRRLFPQCVRIADDFRRVFGSDVKLRYAAEDGREIGKQMEPEPVYPVKQLS